MTQRIYRSQGVSSKIRASDLSSLDSNITNVLEGHMPLNGKAIKVLIIECDRPVPRTKLTFVNPEYIAGLKQELGPLEKMIGKPVRVYFTGMPFNINYGISAKY
ncbi:MAG TPA: hypothetical protein VJH68_05545 [Candidatus Nanoarchaeia archaeon]|nr:hypothetical protein [Candidatus Nanoarchaeia archaeon]